MITAINKTKSNTRYVFFITCRPLTEEITQRLFANHKEVCEEWGVFAVNGDLSMFWHPDLNRRQKELSETLLKIEADVNHQKAEQKKLLSDFLEELSNQTGLPLQVDDESPRPLSST